MMVAPATVRLGAVGYLNARPLTWTLDQAPQQWHVRYDLPAVCARLLYDGEVDLGLVPSIEYLRSEQYRFVPGVGIGSRGPVASVALFTRRPVDEIRHIALDTSSRTSVTLIRVLCQQRSMPRGQAAPARLELARSVSCRRRRPKASHRIRRLPRSTALETRPRRSGPSHT